LEATNGRSADLRNRHHVHRCGYNGATMNSLTWLIFVIIGLGALLTAAHIAQLFCAHRPDEDGNAHTHSVGRQSASENL
jgi:hypothetical protein